MNIAIDGRTITSQTTGIGQYTYNLVKTILSIDTENKYILFLSEPQNDIQAKNLIKINIEGYERMILNRYWENFLLPKYLQLYSVQVYFSPAYALPFLPRINRYFPFIPPLFNLDYYFNTKKKVKYVVTIHDVITYVCPQYFTPKMRMWQSLFVPNVVKLADHIITVSETTKNDLLKLFHVDPKKISAIAPWFNTQFKPIVDESIKRNVRERYKLPKKFILYLGTIEPRKNILGIIKAYTMLPKILQNEFTLVIAGGIGWYAENIIEEITKLKTTHNIILPGYIRHEDLPVLYTLASVFVFPSFYEGFGSPPLESMACGTPVITSNNSAMPEAVGNAAILIDPSDTTALSKSIENILTDDNLSNSYRTLGFQRVQQFNPKKLAEETIQLFSKLIS
jgi:glycosyltransferase involved in cell wall biosynthesis